MSKKQFVITETCTYVYEVDEAELEGMDDPIEAVIGLWADELHSAQYFVSRAYEVDAAEDVEPNTTRT